MERGWKEGMERGYSRDAEEMKQGCSKDVMGMQMMGWNGDAAGMQQGYGRDALGMQQGCSRGAAEMQQRHSRDEVGMHTDQLAIASLKNRNNLKVNQRFQVTFFKLASTVQFPSALAATQYGISKYLPPTSATDCAGLISL